MSDDATTSDFEIPSWFWWLGLALAAGCVGLAVLWYVKHPERSIFEDFARRGEVGVPETNGAVPHSPATVGADPLEG